MTKMGRIGRKIKKFFGKVGNVAKKIGKGIVKAVTFLPKQALKVTHKVAKPLTNVLSKSPGVVGKAATIAGKVIDHMPGKD